MPEHAPAVAVAACQGYQKVTTAARHWSREGLLLGIGAGVGCCEALRQGRVLLGIGAGEGCCEALGQGRLGIGTGVRMNSVK